MPPNPPLLGADRGEASTYAVGSHLLLIAWITVSGVVAMVALSLRPGELLQRGEAATPEQGGR